MDRVRVGLGVIIPNADGKILIAERKGSHAPYFSIPGGKLELGESFEAGAAREIYEELGIKLLDLQVIAITNNLKTYAEEGVHFISVILLAASYVGEPTILEPEKCEDIRWADPTNLPQPHFDASKLGVECWLKGIPYVQSGSGKN